MRSPAAGKLDHDHDDLSAITNLVRQSLHGWEVADNGEIMMIATTPEVRDRCAGHEPDPDQGG